MKQNPKKLDNMQLATFCSQLSMVLSSGISPAEGITLMADDSSSPEEKELLQNMVSVIYESGSLHTALEEAAIFPDYTIKMVTIGEETGRLDHVLSSLADHYEREEHIKSALTNAITYPLIMMGIMTLILITILVKVMPVFNSVFNQLGAQMTSISQILMSAGRAIGGYSVILTVIFVALVLLVVLGIKTSKGRQIFTALISKLGIGRRFILSMDTCRFADSLAITLSSGLSDERCIQLISDLNYSSIFSEKLSAVSQKMASGEDMTTAIGQEDIFTGLHGRLMSIGRITGTLDSTMVKIANLCQEDIDQRTEKFLAFIEPSLVIILSIVVGVILLTVMFPLLGIISAI